MRKKIIIVLSLFSLLILLGGIYLVQAIETNTARFDELIMLHQVEILREHLLLHIRRVQADLYLQSTGRRKNVREIVEHVAEMEDSINSCFDCHHSENVERRIQSLKDQIAEYEHSLSRVLTMEANPARHRAEEEATYELGDKLIRQGDTMIALTNSNLNQRTETALRTANRTKSLLIALVTFGPLLSIGLAFTLIRNFTKPINVLLTATKRLKTGNLDYRIRGLKDEFAELATAFNDMAGSLRGHMQAIEESEKRYRLLFESAGDAIFILEAEGEQAGKIVQANQSAGRMHGYPAEELMTMNIKDLDSPEASLGFPVRLQRLLAGERIQAEITHCKKDGTVFPVEISAALLEVGDHRYILAIDRDITERKQAEAELRRAQQIKVAGELATGLAHEIKNPLSGIMVSMEALSEESYLPDEDRDLLQKVIKEIKRIEFLMNGLLNFTRPPKPQFEKTAVNEILENVASLVLKERSGRRNGEAPIHLVRDFAEYLPEIMADPAQLEQIFMNLLLNAADAMPEGGTVSIKTGFDRESGFVRIDVSDTGQGIDSAIIGKIFRPFFSTKAKGTGLGLAITKRLVEEHGGRINLQNNPAGGVTFTITLPAPNQEGA